MPTPVRAEALEALGLTPAKARDWTQATNRVLRKHPGRGRAQDAAWRELVETVLRARPTPFAVHEYLYAWVYRGRNEARQGPAPAWFPPADALSKTNVGRVMKGLVIRDFPAFHRWTTGHRDAFWDELLRRVGIRFRRTPKTVRDKKSSVRAPRWLPGAELNITESCFRAPADKPAILYGHEGVGHITTLTYGQLDRLANQVAHGLDRLRVGSRARVALYLPMTPESVAAYLGVLRSGRSVVGIADASAPADLAKRIRISRAELVITMDAYVRDGKPLKVYEKVKKAKGPRAIVLASEARGVATPLRPEDLTWTAFVGDRAPYAAQARKPDEETNILFSSGTTKDPKAIVWTQTTPIKCVVDAYLHHDVQADDVVAWPTSYGWMMGPWLTFAALVHGATMALYNGSPLSRAFGEFVSRARVTMLGVVPKLVRSWKANATMEGLDWSRIRRFSSTGETSDPSEMFYLMWLAGYKPVIEYCGGTEIGGGYITGTMVQPAAPATFTTAACGLDFLILDDKGAPARRGEVALVPPSIGLSTRILNYDHDEEYFDGFFRGPDGTELRRHGDQLERLGAGFFRHHGRLDDMINLNGVKTSVEEIRAAILHQPDVYDVKPIAVDVEGKGQRVLVVYAVPKDKKRVADRELAARIQAESSRRIKEHLNPLLSNVHEVVLVPELPQAGPGKTRTQRDFLKDYQARAGAAAGNGKHAARARVTAR
ncbi:MAG: AMP-binding protein [Euryarchaeota archaeon]|nr:AMP-binding protein [Euryarchaeota archaeon]